MLSDELDVEASLGVGVHAGELAGDLDGGRFAGLFDGDDALDGRVALEYSDSLRTQKVRGALKGVTGNESVP